MIAELVLMNLLTWGTAETLNFLVIVVDDLRPALGCYGDANAHTPNIDKLAERSICFDRAYAQQSLCAPSRNSLLTSRRPDTLQLYDFYSYWRKTVGNFTTLPQHMKDHGYRTKSIGKIFHPGISSNYSDDSPYSWSDPPFHPFTNRYKNSAVCPCLSKPSPAENIVCPVSVKSMPGETLPDLETLQAAKEFLKNQSNDKRPFFLAVGFQKPHIPLKYPREYLKHHPLSKFNINDHYEWPKNISNVAYNPWTDLRKRDDVKALLLQFPWEKIPVDFAKTIIQSYYAAVTYIDDLIGTLLDELRSSKFHDTVIVLTSDHGWSLGEHAEWAKYSNFEVALRVPLIISIPRSMPRVTVTNVGRSGFLYPIFGQPEERDEGNSREKKRTIEYVIHFIGNTTRSKSSKHEDITNSMYRVSTDYFKSTHLDSMVELVDIFPTIAELAGFPIPVCAHSNENSNSTETETTQPKLCSEGISLLPLIKATMENKPLRWKKAAFSQYPRPGLEPTMYPNSDKPRLRNITIMGYTLRTAGYRYTAWVQFVHTTRKPNWRKILAEELYDHSVDSRENFNVVMNPAFYEIKEELKNMLQSGWRKALPDAIRYQNERSVTI